jgi:hypothetical protein
LYAKALPSYLNKSPTTENKDSPKESDSPASLTKKQLKQQAKDQKKAKKNRKKEQKLYRKQIKKKLTSSDELIWTHTIPALPPDQYP